MKVVFCFFLMGLVAALFFMLHEKNPKNKNSIGSKKEWANLQSMDLIRPYLTISENVKIGLYNDSEILILNEKCFVLLNAQSPPYFKAVGECSSCMLTKNEIEQIRKVTHSTQTVLNVLEVMVNDSIIRDCNHNKIR